MPYAAGETSRGRSFFRPRPPCGRGQARHRLRGDRDGPSRLSARLDPHPNFLVEVVCKRVAQWLNERERTTNEHAPRHQVADDKGDRHVNDGKRQRLDHDNASHSQLAFDTFHT